MTEITMPKLSDTMTEGVLGAWKKSVGDVVSRGDVLAEVETDKATMELEAFVSGVLLEQKVAAGQIVAVGTVIGLVGEASEAAAVVSEPSVHVPDKNQVETEPLSPLTETVQQSPDTSTITAQPSDNKSSPVVRRRARELGVELDNLQGSGPGGRVLLDDIEAFARTKAAEPDEIKPLTQMRKRIMKTVSESWQTIPHFSVLVDVRMDEVENILRQFRASGIRITLGDVIIKASAMALPIYPLLNASLMPEAVMLHRDINIGLVVAVPDGLLVPVVRGCQTLSLKDISKRSRQLIDSARDGRLREDEMHYGTFSISNLGMYGVTQFSAVILPPQVAILAVGAVKDAVIMKKGQPVVERVMKLTLSADHRVVDGLYATQFLNELKQILECPIRLTI